MCVSMCKCVFAHACMRVRARVYVFKLSGNRTNRNKEKLIVMNSHTFSLVSGNKIGSYLHVFLIPSEHLPSLIGLKRPRNYTVIGGIAK